MQQPRKVLITAFAPFGTWHTNSSRLCLERLVPLLSPTCEVTTRIYPVEFDVARPLIEADLQQNFDLSIHLGQAQTTARIRLEAVGLNVGAVPGQREGEVFALVPHGPAAYQTPLPLAAWSERLRTEGFPAYVSYHAGTYLCNATLYWAQHIIETRRLRTQTCFVHVPLDISQVAGLPGDYLTLPADFVARGVARLIEMWTEISYA